jgi:CHAT domain-containing protein
MRAFYTALKKGDSVAQALQKAQAFVRQDYPNPYYWAAFNVLGDPDRKIV